jgi:hypothetical protein
MNNHKVRRTFNMGTPHVHAEVIKAWADGAVIQFRYSVDGKWYECLSQPGWDPLAQFRVKPEPLKYRVALLRGFDGELYTTTSANLSQEETIESYSSFVRWLTDWTEVEI